MIDIIFLLLVFYMVAGTLARDDASAIEPPQDITDDENLRSTGALIIGSDGKTYIRKTEVSVEDWLNAHKNGDLSGDALKVAADGQLQADKLEDVLRTLSDAGETNILLITRKKPR
ncbi:ExbD/TolR family protein [Roseibium aggregatum]|uniref:Biopolymer transporter ExbD n=1 Tax=Roseibium aggregatum TaxID=187304 RepID=A0A939EH86_9HYPH|nr:biopolymer transporter ExbD [Roseibium aggregatum]MBN9672979.1 biopolymer transporter ExbD [Roseibium aggregatum]